MQVKLINEALKRVQLPDLSPSKLEAFKAGVRALAYELEKAPEDVVSVTLDTTRQPPGLERQQLVNGCPECGSVPEVPLTQQLSDLIRKVFENEEAFRTVLLPEDAVNTEEFYMASGRCYVEYINEDIEVYTTIKTADFLAWAEGLKDE